LLSRLLRGASLVFSGLSVAWIALLLALVLRCRIAVHPFPALAKFSPLGLHYQLTLTMLRSAPIFALLSLVFVLGAWRLSKNEDSNRLTGIVLGACLAASLFFVAGNPAGFFSWLLN
jgi:hypothetical protein